MKPIHRRPGYRTGVTEPVRRSPGPGPPAVSYSFRGSRESDPSRLLPPGHSGSDGKVETSLET
eukprot:763594-Hanusia_phi.AAC.1